MAKILKHPDKDDVILGKGQSIRDHPGNVRYRNIAWQHLEEYENARSNSQKRKIAEKILGKVKSVDVIDEETGFRYKKNARFLKKLKGGYYAVLTEKDGDFKAKVMRSITDFMGKQRRLEGIARTGHRHHIEYDHILLEFADEWMSGDYQADEVPISNTFNSFHPTHNSQYPLGSWVGDDRFVSDGLGPDNGGQFSTDEFMSAQPYQTTPGDTRSHSGRLWNYDYFCNVQPQTFDKKSSLNTTVIVGSMHDGSIPHDGFIVEEEPSIRPNRYDVVFRKEATQPEKELLGYIRFRDIIKGYAHRYFQASKRQQGRILEEIVRQVENLREVDEKGTSHVYKVKFLVANGDDKEYRLANMKMIREQVRQSIDDCNNTPVPQDDVVVSSPDATKSTSENTSKVVPDVPVSKGASGSIPSPEDGASQTDILKGGNVKNDIDGNRRREQNQDGIRVGNENESETLSVTTNETTSTDETFDQSTDDVWTTIESMQRLRISINT